MSRGPRVLLVSLPWASTVRPSLALGLLTSAARERGFECEARYLNLAFAPLVGGAPYEAMAVERSLEALGEHLFAVDLFGARALGSDRFLERPLTSRTNGVTAELALDLDTLVALRDLIVPDFLDQVSAEVLDSGAEVIGFSCVFNQVMPSLALANRLRKANPSLRILLGGGSVHGAMGEEYARAFPRLLDHVFTGEADLVFPAFLEALAEGRPIRLPGVTVEGRLETHAAPVTALDELPTPDYDSYFAARAALARSGARIPAHRDIPYESARGCWWGEKHHCTFCGLNTEGMASRTKSSERVAAELTSLARRYRTTVLTAADNILAHSGYRDLLPRLAGLQLDLRLFYEIKANVTRDDVAALWRAGVLWVQPGIESFADPVLQLMRKGVSAAQNIQLLKWLQEYGITPYYNLLVGFPGETDRDYEEMLGLLPSLFHLTPPMGRGANHVQVHRFSPFFNEPEALGITGIRPEPYYRHLIPLRVADPARYAYFFERDVPRDAPFRRWVPPLNRMLDRWRRARHRLTAMLGPGFIAVRQCGSRERDLARLEGETALVFLLADAATTEARIAGKLERILPGRPVDVPGIVASLLEQRLLVRAGERIVGVVPLERARTGPELARWIERWGADQPGGIAPCTSPAARWPDSKAPSIQPGRQEVWSPAK